MQSTINQRRSDLGAAVDRIIHTRVNLLLALIVATVAITLAIVVPSSGGGAVTLDAPGVSAADRAAQAEFESWLAREVEVERITTSANRAAEVNATGRERQFLATFEAIVHSDEAWIPSSDASFQEWLSYLVHTS